VVLEQSERLEAAGAGIQLSPNAVRVLLALGLGERLKLRVTLPGAVLVMSGASGREIVRVPLGARAESQYGAPYWVIHRADMQAALVEAIEQTPDVTLRLGAGVEDFAVDAKGVTVQARTSCGAIDERGIALVGADGLWSTVGARLGQHTRPRFCQRSAWRAVVPADRVSEPFRAPLIFLWLGPDAHLAHYPVNNGRAINIVAIVRDAWQQPGWSSEGQSAELMVRFGGWAPAPRGLLAVPERWLKWALFDRPRLRCWSDGPITLLGDAAHPMLPFLAQGGAMAVEDAAVLAECLGAVDEPRTALAAYEQLRQQRTARAQRAARINGIAYHLKGPAAFLRDLALRAGGGESLLRRYDWLYGWQPR
jgi:salicylate hydroxylase